MQRSAPPFGNHEPLILWIKGELAFCSEHKLAGPYRSEVGTKPGEGGVC